MYVDTWCLTFLFTKFTFVVSVDTWCFLERLRSLLEDETSLWRFMEDEPCLWRFLEGGGGVRSRFCGSQSRPGVAIFGLSVLPGGVVSVLGVEAL